MTGQPPWRAMAFAKARGQRPGDPLDVGTGDRARPQQDQFALDLTQHGGLQPHPAGASVERCGGEGAGLL